MKRKHNSIIVGNPGIGSLVAKLIIDNQAVNLVVVNSKLKEEPKQITNSYDFNVISDIKINDTVEHNPWPSPKGRRSKRKY